MSLVTSFDTLTQMFDSITKKFIDETKPAFLRKINGIWSGVSYKNYRNQVKFFSTGLISMGLKQGDNVALISENRIEWPVSDIALLSAGAVVVPIYPSLTAQQMEYILTNAEIKYIILSNQFQFNKIKKIKSNIQSLKKIITFNNISDGSEESTINYSDVIKIGEKFCDTNESYFDELLTGVKPEDTATIIYTSGTTGEPKGVELSHKNFVSNLRAVASFTEVNEKDISISYLPLCHVFERMAGNYFIFGCGATIAYADSIDSVAENFLEIRPTIMTTVPRLFEKVHAKIIKSVSKSSELKQKIFNSAISIGKKYAETAKKGFVPLNLRFKRKLADKLVFSQLRDRLGGRMRFFCSGGATLKKEIGEFFEAIGVLIMEGYGLTETSPVIAMNRMTAYKFGTVGWVLPGVEINIASDGEILTRGNHVMKGYYNNKKATDEVIDKDGWFKTGDIGHMDSESYLTITDRKKNIFVSSGGKNIAPQPLEDLFLSSKYIDQFVLLGDRRQFLSALIVPDFGYIKEFADSNNIPYNDINELINNEQIYKLIETDIGLIQKNLSNYERVRKFVLLEKPLSLEDGEITPSLKIKRKVIEERYSSLIETMYQ